MYRTRREKGRKETKWNATASTRAVAQTNSSLRQHRGRRRRRLDAPSEHTELQPCLPANTVCKRMTHNDNSPSLEVLLVQLLRPAGGTDWLSDDSISSVARGTGDCLVRKPTGDGGRRGPSATVDVVVGRSAVTETLHRLAPLVTSSAHGEAGFIRGSHI